MSPNESQISTPLATLLAMLKQEGFDISTATFIDIQKVLANLGDEELADFSELRSLLSPLICRNKEEQEHFNNIFEKYAQYIKEKDIRSTEQVEEISKPRNYRKIILASLGGMLLVSAIIYYLLPPKHKPFINVITISKENAGYLLTNEPVIFRAEIKDTVPSKKYFVTYKIDDSTYENTREVEKTFAESGSSNLTAWLLNERGDTLNIFENNNIPVNCEPPPSVSIVKELSINDNAAVKKYDLQFINASKDSSAYKYKWYVNDNLVSESKTLSARARVDSGYSVKVIIDTKGLHCSSDSLMATLFERPEYSLSVIGTKPLNLTANRDWNRILPAVLFLFIIPAILATILFFKKTKTAAQKKKEEPLPVETKEYTGPFKIEFEDQANKISPENEISQLAGAMRKRHVNDLLFLNVPKTIQATIRSGGFPFLQFTPKTEPTDFLVFIDKENAEGLHVTLFEYIIKKLEGEQVNINSYSYYKEPLLLSNEKLNQSMLPVEKISRLYPNTVLFIFSDTQSFFETLSTKLKPWVTERFKSWEHKIIITPVPVNDWDYKENTLLQAGFTVVPADLNANHIITNEINNLINRQKIQFNNIPASYSSRFVNFDDWEQLVKYLDGDAMMVQWVAALAVYPYIDWKATVAIGKALEEKNNLKRKLVNYTSLLKLSRIKWMQTGVLPDALRLEMLAHVDNESEAIARDTMITLFNEVEKNITSSSLIADELELNKTVNKFLLHTHSPREYALSDDEHARMKDYVQNEWLDQPLEKYLNDAENTLLKNNNGDKSISPSKYFEIVDEIEKKKYKRDRMIRRSLAAAILIAGIFLIFNFLNNAANYSTPQQFVDITFNLGSSGVFSTFKNTLLSISANNNTYTGEMISDTSMVVKGVKVDSVQQASLVLSSDSSGSFEQPIDLTSGQYTIALLPPGPPVPLYIRYNNPAAYTTMEQQITDAFSGFNISAQQSNFSDSSRIVYYENNQKARADSIVQIVKNSLGIDVREEFTEEIRTPAAVPVLFLNLANNACNNIAANALPASLNEIWSGGTSNRLINIIPNRKMIYYSTGDKKTYGTYRIEEICLNANGMYKIITNAGNGYQDFLVKNVNASSFELSVCQNRYKTIQEARAVDESFCDHFNVMRIYYENDKTKAFLNQPGKLPADQLSKLRNMLTSGRSQYKTPLFKTYVVSNSTNAGVINRTELKSIIANLFSANGNNSFIDQQFKGTPFNRNYVQVNAEEDKNDYPPVRNGDCNVVYYSVKEALDAAGLNKMVCILNISGQNLKAIPSGVYQLKNLRILDIRGNVINADEINKLKSTFPDIDLRYTTVNQSQSKESLLTRINFDAKGYPDSDAQAMLRQIVTYLNEYRNASARIVFYYTDDYSQKEAGSYMNTMQNYLQQLKYNRTQVKFELKNNAAQQQQQQIQKAPSKTIDEPKYADVFGTNFPPDFSNQLNRKASAK